MGRPRTLPDADCLVCGKRFRTRGWKDKTGAYRLTEYCSSPCGDIGRTVPAEIRFWRFVDKRGPDECWPWTGGTTKGYGAFNGGYAARFSWELANGKDFPEGLLSCHTCDTAICVNPAHIYPGTYQQNMDDRSARGRCPQGESHWKSTLTEDAVRTIRMLRESGMTHVEIAAKYGISRESAGTICRREVWAHVT